MEEIEQPPVHAELVDLIQPNPQPGAYSFRHSPPRPPTETVQSSSSEDDESEEHKPETKRMRTQLSPPEPQHHQRRSEPTCSLCTVLLLVSFVLFLGGAIWYYLVWVMPQQSETEYLHDLRTTEHESVLDVALLDVASLKMRIQTLRFLAASLQHHLKPHYRPCVCMHHLAVPPPMYRVCAVPGLPLMANPRLKGRGNETDEHNEVSLVACPGKAGPVRRKRFRTILLEWQTLSPDAETLWGHFEGATAACMQLALDEMTLGNKMCA